MGGANLAALATVPPSALTPGVNVAAMLAGAGDAVDAFAGYTASGLIGCHTVAADASIAAGDARMTASPRIAESGVTQNLTIHIRKREAVG